MIFPYLNGDDTNSQPDQAATRYVINFFDWDENKAASYNECYKIIKERVYHQRQSHSEERVRRNWWLYQRIRPELYAAISNFSQVFVCSAVSSGTRLYW